MNTTVIWTPGVTLDGIEQQVIQLAFKFYRQNKTATAQALGISIRTLDAKLEKYANEQRDREQRDAELKKRNENFLARQRGTAQSNAIAPEKRNDDARADAGVRVESASENQPEPPVSMSERKEVQKVLSGQVSSGSSRKAR